jgi:hypothetical protein
MALYLRDNLVSSKSKLSHVEKLHYYTVSGDKTPLTVLWSSKEKILNKNLSNSSKYLPFKKERLCQE